LALLSPEWLSMLKHTMRRRSGSIGAWISTGPPVHFGGPAGHRRHAEDKLVIEITPIDDGGRRRPDAGQSAAQALGASIRPGESRSLVDCGQGGRSLVDFDGVAQADMCGR